MTIKELQPQLISISAPRPLYCSFGKIAFEQINWHRIVCLTNNKSGTAHKTPCGYHRRKTLNPSDPPFTHLRLILEACEDAASVVAENFKLI